MSSASGPAIEPGLCVIHGNQLEDLTSVLTQWLSTYPLGPLDDDVILVQSNGMAEWLRHALAADEACGISAGQQFQMPSRFLWQAYRAVLGPEQIPRRSPFDKAALTWRFMQLLPELVGEAGFEPLERFLADDSDQRKRYQLATRLADLFDQYQVYRADWLADWEAGDEVLRKATGETVALTDNRWQPLLWQRLIEALPGEQRSGSRAHIHRRFLDALDALDAPPATLPPRILVFGISSLPQQVLEALHALAAHCQVIVFIPNPCRYYWGDIIEDRDLLRRQQRRHPHKLADIEPEHQHRHANPLLAAWGKQGRDFIGLLYDYDIPDRYRGWFNEIDLFRDPADVRSNSVLTALQSGIFELEPAPEGPQTRTPDDSLVFHIAHGPQREVEILHDRLLAAFEAAGADTDPLAPRDIVVMVPDIERYAPYIEAVFGHFEASDERYIPYAISDRSQRTSQPTAVALEKLLDLPNWRFTVSEVMDLLEAPAVRQRFGISETDLVTLRDWIDGAGIRWGLHGEHRSTFALRPDFEQNSWWFGLRRMLLGYASGSGQTWRDTVPYPEVGGLEATLAGRLVTLIDALAEQWRALREPATPWVWASRLTHLLDALFAWVAPDDLRLREQLDQSLADWREACADAGFEDTLPLAVVSQVWLDTLGDTGVSQRFLAGRVNFCTLMPMRSVPFRRVYLLGMNDDAYPRAQPPQDFDLMAVPGQYRPGDRSRRNDDRYLFLEAVLAAREHLHISWVGRQARDNNIRPPSVLVAQLRDHLDACWRAPDDAPLSEAVTREHPLQPFNPDYFQGRDDNSVVPLFTYAREWRRAHERSLDKPADERLPAPLPEQPREITTQDLTRFLRQPVDHFYRNRLNVRLTDPESGDDETEPFSIEGLTSHQLGSRLIDAMIDALPDKQDDALEQACTAAQQAGELPVGALGEHCLAPIKEAATSVAQAWRGWASAYPELARVEELTWREPLGSEELVLSQWLATRTDGDAGRVRLQFHPGPIRDRPSKAITLWPDHLLACAQDLPLTSVLVGADAEHVLAPLAAEEAAERLSDLLSAWFEGLCQPLPLAERTGLRFLEREAHHGSTAQGLTDNKVRDEYEGVYRKVGELRYQHNAALRRSYPSFQALTAGEAQGVTAFVHWAWQLYAPLRQNLQEREQA